MTSEESAHHLLPLCKQSCMSACNYNPLVIKVMIERVAEDKYKCAGIITKIDSTTVEITELPIKMWTRDYKEMLEEWIAARQWKRRPLSRVLSCKIADHREATICIRYHHA